MIFAGNRVNSLQYQPYEWKDVTIDLTPDTVTVGKQTQIRNLIIKWTVKNPFPSKKNRYDEYITDDFHFTLTFTEKDLFSPDGSLSQGGGLLNYIEYNTIRAGPRTIKREKTNNNFHLSGILSCQRKEIYNSYRDEIETYFTYSHIDDNIYGISLVYFDEFSSKPHRGEMQLYGDEYHYFFEADEDKLPEYFFASKRNIPYRFKLISQNSVSISPGAVFEPIDARFISSITRKVTPRLDYGQDDIEAMNMTLKPLYGEYIELLDNELFAIMKQNEIYHILWGQGYLYHLPGDEEHLDVKNLANEITHATFAAARDSDRIYDVNFQNEIAIKDKNDERERFGLSLWGMAGNYGSGGGHDPVYVFGKLRIL